MPKLTGAERQRRWRAKRDALAKEALQARALPSPLDESVLIQNLQRLAAGDGAVSLKANTFLLTHCFGWSEYQPPPREPQPGKKEQQQRDAETALDEDEFPEWSDLLLQ